MLRPFHSRIARIRNSKPLLKGPANQDANASAMLVIMACVGQPLVCTSLHLAGHGAARQKPLISPSHKSLFSENTQVIIAERIKPCFFWGPMLTEFGVREASTPCKQPEAAKTNHLPEERPSTLCLQSYDLGLEQSGVGEQLRILRIGAVRSYTEQE